ncbi:hypothetical protein HOY82DRAFT_489311 [Tuber indicum]|nr:hypothetical protein HOY82DRAFT_489311 [Tuber indicum]
MEEGSFSGFDISGSEETSCWCWNSLRLTMEGTVRRRPLTGLESAYKMENMQPTFTTELTAVGLWAAFYYGPLHY